MPLQLTLPEERFQIHRDHYYYVSAYEKELIFEDKSEMRNSVYPFKERSCLVHRINHMSLDG